MSSDSFMFLFDVIILCYGVYLVYSGYQMKRTHQPPNVIINQTELIGARDVKGFCEAMYKPTIIFGVTTTLYGIVGIINDQVMDQPIVNFVCITLFLILCVWYVREMRKNKDKYLK